jgi:hypothetical protein
MAKWTLILGPRGTSWQFIARAEPAIHADADTDQWDP